MRTGLWIVVVLVAIGAAAMRPVSAQESTPELPATGQVAAFLPHPNVFGEGWEAASTYTPSTDGAVFSASTGAVYLGPSGARIVIEVYQNLPGRAAVQRSWEDIGTTWDYYAYFSLDIDSEFGRVGDLAELPLPSGTVDARRLDGREGVFGVPIAVSMYAVDPDITILLIVSGSVNGISGYEATDHVVSLAVSADQI